MRHPEDSRGPRVPNMLNIETLGEAMRPETLRGEAFRLSREERDHVAGHALDSIGRWALSLAASMRLGVEASVASTEARKIAALSNLLGDIGWEREAEHTTREELSNGEVKQRFLGELFPPARLRLWLEEWQRQDDRALVEAEKAVALDRTRNAIPALRDSKFPTPEIYEEKLEQAVADAQTKLGTGAILLARLEKWMASHETDDFEKLQESAKIAIEDQARPRFKAEEELRALRENFREELEIAWLRGWAARKTWAHFEPTGSEPSDQELMAADYAERVVGGSTKPKRPEVGNDEP